MGPFAVRWYCNTVIRSPYFIEVEKNEGQIRLINFHNAFGLPGMVSLAWFSEPAHPGTTVEFDWSIIYNFVWSRQGELIPGVTFKASQTINTEPSDITKNSIGFTKEAGAYRFTETNRTTKSGTLGIYTDQTVPHGEASVGVGMSGSGTFAVTATPNYSFAFTPHPKYWVVFGTYEKGEVMDIESLTSTAEIIFEPDVYSMKAILKNDNTWEVKR